MRTLIIVTLLSFISYSQVYEYSPLGYVGGYSGSNIEIKIVSFSSANKTCSFNVRKADGTNFGSAVTVNIRKNSISGTIIKTFTISAGTNNNTSSSYFFGDDFASTNSVNYYAKSSISGYEHRAGPVQISQRLATPSLGSPSEGATSVPMPVQFSWNSVSSAQNYRVQVSKSSSWNEETGFSSVYAEFTTSSTSYSWGGAEFGVKYYWSVRAGSSSITNSKYSAFRNFTTISNTRPVLSDVSISPTVGYLGTTFTFRVRYTDSDGHAPSVKKVWLTKDNGASYPDERSMTLESGLASSGIYSTTFQVNDLRTTKCKFDFNDGTGTSNAQATVVYGDINITNRQPVLSNVVITPNEGFLGTIYTFKVRYDDADGNAPVTQKLWLTTDNGATFTSEVSMTKESGTPAAGVYSAQYQVNNLNTTKCKFDFNDGSGTSNAQATAVYGNINVVSELIFPKSSDKPLSGSVNFRWASFSPGENYLLKVRDITDDPNNGPIVFHQNCGTVTNYSVNDVLKPGRQYRWVAYTSTKVPEAITFSCGLGIIGVNTSNQLRSSSEGVTFELTAGCNTGNINAFVYIYDLNNNLVNSGNESLNYVLNSNPVKFRRSFMLNEGEYKLRFRIFDESNPNLSVWYPSPAGFAEGPKIENYIEQNNYKVGVVYHLDNINSASYDLDQMISDLGDGVTSFSDGQKTVDLVVQTEIKWSETETSYNEFNFAKYQQFAQLCKEKGIKWSPLLSYHYQPSWIVGRATSEYGYDPRMRDHNGQVNPGNFMPYSPSSPVWTSYAKNWTEAVFNFLTPYLENTIEEVFIGNEMMYSGNILTSYDEYSRQAWRVKHGDLSELPESLTDEFQQFRTEEWGKAISSVLNKAQMKTQGYDVVVTSKFYSYYLHPTQVQNVPNFGVTLKAVERLSKNLGAIGTDEYPPNPTWYGILPLLSKPIYMSEFNKRDIDIPPYATENEVFNWLTQAAEKNTRYFSFYAWNPTGNPGTKYTMNNDHKRALKRFIFSLIPFQINAQNEQLNQAGFDFEQDTLLVGNAPKIDSVHIVGAEYLGDNRYSVIEGATVSLIAEINKMQNDSIGIFWEASNGVINNSGNDLTQVQWQVPLVLDSNSNTTTHEVTLKVSNGYHKSAVKILQFDVRRNIDYQNIDYSSQDFTPPVISLINSGEIDTLYHDTYFDIRWHNPTDNMMVTRVKSYYIYRDTLRMISDFWPYNGQLTDRFYVHNNLLDSLSFIVVAFDSNGNYAISRSNQYRILRIERPTTPILLSPVNGSNGSISPIDLMWTKSLRVEKYKLQVSTDSLFTALVLNDSTLTDTTKQLPNLANYSQFYWRVKAVNIGGESDWSTVWNFKTLGNPYASNLITPVNGSQNQPLTALTFKWTKAKERIETIQKYQFQVSTDSLFATTFVNDSTLTDTMKVVGGMGYSTNYFWRVRAQNQTGWGDWSNTWKFTTIVEKPTMPVLAMPANGAKGLLNPVRTKWHKSLRVEKYRLQLSTDSLFTSLVVNDSTLTDTTKLLPNLANYSQFYWRVKAVNIGGESDWSGAWNFKTLGNPYASNLLTPVNGSQNQPVTTLTFKWTKAKERIESIQKYQFQISTDSLFATLFINDSTLTDTQRVAGGMNYSTGYFWRVRAQNQTGWGDWSEMWKFTTIIEKPSIPTLASPANNSNALVQPITLKWNKSLRVEKYTLEVSESANFASLIISDTMMVDTFKVLIQLSNQKTYYWRVKSRNIGGSSDYSTVWSFRTLGYPMSVNLISPANGSLNLPVNEVMLKWSTAGEQTLRSVTSGGKGAKKGKNDEAPEQEGEGRISPKGGNHFTLGSTNPNSGIESIGKYWLEIKTDTTSASAFYSDSTLTDTTKLISGFGYLTTYYWRVKANNEVGWGGFSTWYRFTTVIERPGVVLLESPADSSTGLIQPIVFKWRRADRAEKYTLEISSSDNFGTIVIRDTSLVDTAKTVTTLAPLTGYYWRVFARNTGGTGDTSVIRRFKTLGTPTTVVTAFPEDNAQNLPVSLTFRWYKATNQEATMRYWFELVIDTTAGIVVRDTLLSDTLKTVNQIQYNKQYFWRVKSGNQIGWGNFSPWARFKTMKRPIFAPTNLAATSTVVGKVNLTWTDNSDNETGFMVLRKRGDTTSTGTMVSIDTVGSNVTNYVDSLVTDTTMFSYQIVAFNSDTVSAPSNFAQVFTLTGLKEMFADQLPGKFDLYQNYPNPFNPTTKIRFAIPKESKVSIELFSMQGERIAELISETMAAGYYETDMEIPQLASGIYLYRIVALPSDGSEPFMATRKLILLK